MMGVMMILFIIVTIFEISARLHSEGLFRPLKSFFIPTPLLLLSHFSHVQLCATP